MPVHLKSPIYPDYIPPSLKGEHSFGSHSSLEQSDTFERGGAQAPVRIWLQQTAFLKSPASQKMPWWGDVARSTPVMPRATKISPVVQVALASIGREVDIHKCVEIAVERQLSD